MEVTIKCITAKSSLKMRFTRLSMVKYLCLLLFIYSNSTMAESNTKESTSELIPKSAPKSIDIISLYYAPFARVEGDQPEEDFNFSDDYSHMTLDPGTAKGVKWVHKANSVFFIEYFSIDTKSKNDVISRDTYKSVTVGSGIIDSGQFSKYLGLYGSLLAGVGVSRFKLYDTKYRAHADLSGELGVIIGKTLSIGAGAKYQIIGYPTETIADVWVLNLSAAIWF